MIAIEETATVQTNGRVVLERPELKPGSQVKVILLVEEPGFIPTSSAGGEPGCFFETVRNLKLDGPSDWSEHLDDYLYHGRPHERE